MTTQEISEYIKKKQALMDKYVETGDDSVFLELMQLERRKGDRNETSKWIASANNARMQSGASR